jgi:hypothetical protein
MGQNSFCAPSFACPLLPALPPAPHPCLLPAPARACPKKYVCHKGGGGVCFSEGGCAASESESFRSYLGCRRSEGSCSALLFMFVLYLSYSTFEGKKGFPPIYSTESTGRVCLRYWYGNYQEIQTKYRPKISKRYTTLYKTASLLYI